MLDRYISLVLSFHQTCWNSVLCHLLFQIIISVLSMSADRSGNNVNLSFKLLFSAKAQSNSRKVANLIFESVSINKSVIDESEIIVHHMNNYLRNINVDDSREHATHISNADDMHYNHSRDTLENVAEEFGILRTVAYGSIHETAYYFADALVGSPIVQRQSVILDTGSSVLAFKCADCISCGSHVDTAFNHNLSESAEPILCSSAWCRTCDPDGIFCAYNVSYMEGSQLYGRWYTDFVTFSRATTYIASGQEMNYYNVSRNSKNLTLISNIEGTAMNADINNLSRCIKIRTPIGCHIEETNLFRSQLVSGILGLEMWTQSGPTTFISSCFSSGFFRNKLFSLCFAEQGGLFSIGATNADYHVLSVPNKNVSSSNNTNTNGYFKFGLGMPNIVWSYFSYLNKSYKVIITGISVGMTQIELGFKNNTNFLTDETLWLNVPGYLQSLVDSGTTLTYFPPHVYNGIWNVINNFVKNEIGKINDNNWRSCTDKATETTNNTNYIYDRKIRQFFCNNERNSGSICRYNEDDENKTRDYNTFCKNETRNSDKEQQGSNVNMQKNQGVNEYLGDFVLQSSANLRRAQSITVKEEMKEKCFYLPNGDADLIHFPFIVVTFLSPWSKGNILFPEEIHDGSVTYAADELVHGSQNAVIWAPAAYMYSKGTDKFRCLAIATYNGERMESILGASFFIGHDVIFDVFNQQVGFVTANCPSTLLHNRLKHRI